jgi:TPR repeat protein
MRNYSISKISTILQFFIVIIFALSTAVKAYNSDETVSAEELQRLHALAEKNDSYALYTLGFMYFYGDSVEKDVVQGEKFLRRYSNQMHDCNSEGKNCSLWMDTKNDVPKKLIEWANIWRAKAKAGDAEAQYILGNVYYNIDDPLNTIGVPSIDTDEAMRWWLKSANQGYSEAEYAMGSAYERGYSGLNEKEAQIQALKWWKKAAMQGHKNAQHNMAVYYANGLGGLEKDKVKAKAWLIISIKSGGRNEDRRPPLDNLTLKEIERAEIEAEQIMQEIRKQ